MKLLAVKTDDHDSNFTVYDKELIYLKSERLKSIKHHGYKGMEWIADAEKLFGSLDQFDAIAINDDPSQRGLENYTDTQFKPYERKFYIYDQKHKNWLSFNNKKLDLDNIYRIDHHYAHAYSDWMFPPSDWQIVVDGIGEIFNEKGKLFGQIWSIYKNYKLITSEITPLGYDKSTLNSFGIEYWKLAVFNNIQGHMEDAPGKLMALQAYGEPNYDYIDQLLLNNTFNSITTDISPQTYFKTEDLKTITADEKINYAATIHHFLGKKLCQLLKKYCPKNDVIYLTGGCAQNILWNTELKKFFPNLRVLPHSTDEGLSLGMIEILRKKFDLPKIHCPDFPFLQKDEVPDVPTKETILRAAQLLAENKIVGWYQGKGEIGPRALGNRSILMNPYIDNGKEILNNKIKHREPYRPFGATILSEFLPDYIKDPIDNPYMLYVGDLKQDIKSISHIDGTCRYQSLPKNSSYFRQLLDEFHTLTNIPLVLNTSLNRGGKPIVSRKIDAIKLYLESEMDALVIGNKIYQKNAT